jgi:hypothetical protein
VKLRPPSPAMVVAVIALLVALSGTAIAAVDFASNAGAVDGRSAVGARASLREAAGRLVATASGGPGKGRVPARFVDGVMRGGTMTLSKYLRTVDNHPGRPTPVLIVPGIGRFDARCDDVDPTRHTQTTRTAINFTASARRASTSRDCSAATSAPVSGPPCSTRPGAAPCRSSPPRTGCSRPS